MLLGDSVTIVQLNLGNRQDLVSRISGWLARAYIDLCMNYPFEELEFPIDDVFQQGVGTYPYPDSSAPNSSTVRAIKTISMTVGQGNQQPVKRRDIKIIRRYNTSSQQGPPAIYGPFNRQIYVRPIPDQSYPFTWDTWILPQVDQTSASTINATPFILPTDWQEILEYMATLRGHISLLERDKAQELHMLLYGDPMNQSQPGLIKTKILIHPAESYDSDYAIRPKNRPYSRQR
jgi:hypothetical protein